MHSSSSSSLCTLGHRDVSSIYSFDFIRQILFRRGRREDINTGEYTQLLKKNEPIWWRDAPLIQASPRNESADSKEEVPKFRMTNVRVPSMHCFHGNSQNCKLSAKVSWVLEFPKTNSFATEQDVFKDNFSILHKHSTIVSTIYGESWCRRKGKAQDDRNFYRNKWRESA